MIDGMDISEVRHVIDKRAQIFRVDKKKDYLREQFVQKSIELLKHVVNKDTKNILAMKDELALYNANYDVKFVNNTHYCLIHGEDFATYSVPLVDGTFVLHAEPSEALQIVNVENFEGTFVVEGSFDVMSAQIFDDKDSQIFSQCINTPPRGIQRMESLFEEHEYIESLKSKDSGKDLIEISIRGFKLSKTKNDSSLDKYQKVDENFYASHGERLPKFLPRALKNKIANIRAKQDLNELSKMTQQSVQAGQYILECYKFKELI